MGYEDIAYEVVRGRMSCDIAIIEVKKNSYFLSKGDIRWTGR